MAQAPVGSAPAAQFMDWLIGYGVKENHFLRKLWRLGGHRRKCLLIPTKALRDEGASYHYVAPSRYIEVDSRALTAIETVLKGKDHSLSRGHDLVDRRFYRETPDKVAYRIEEGCRVVEMECASLAAVAQLRDAVWGLLLFTADSLADLENYDQRDWGSEAFEKALELCLEMVHHL